VEEGVTGGREEMIHEKYSFTLSTEIFISPEITYTFLSTVSILISYSARLIPHQTIHNRSIIPKKYFFI